MNEAAISDLREKHPSYQLANKTWPPLTEKKNRNQPNFFLFEKSEPKSPASRGMDVNTPGRVVVRTAVQ